MKKKIFFLITAAVALTILFATCRKEYVVSVESVKLNASASQAPLKVGDTLKLSATVLPADAYNPMVKWTSSNPSVAKVEEGNGIMGEEAIVTALSPGQTTIIVTTVEGGFTATMQITVNMAVTGIALNKTSLTLIEGNSETLIATITPANASNKVVAWKSNNTAIASVDSDGKVLARTVGSTIITATTQDGSKSAECTVNVTTSHVSVTSVTLNKTSLDLVAGNSESLFVSVKPDNATNKNVGWTISPVSGIATIDQNGKVTAVSAGTATVTVTSVDDNTKKATCTITVTPIHVPVTSISMQSTLTLKEDATFKLTPTITPSTATNKTINWMTSNSSVATIGNEGTVTGKTPGVAVITASTEDGGKQAQCTVTVESNNVAVTSITLDLSTLTLAGSNTGTLTANVWPTTATDRTVTWTSSDETVAKVSGSGYTRTITPEAPTIGLTSSRTTTITVKSVSSPAVSATCVVTVTYVPVASVAINGDDPLVLEEDEEKILTATVSPANASIKTVTWAIDPPAPTVAVINAKTGRLIAMGVGTAKVKATSDADNTKSKTIDIKVE